MFQGKVFHIEVTTRAKALGKSLECLQSNVELRTASEEVMARRHQGGQGPDQLGMNEFKLCLLF